MKPRTSRVEFLIIRLFRSDRAYNNAMAILFWRRRLSKPGRRKPIFLSACIMALAVAAGTLIYFKITHDGGRGQSSTPEPAPSVVNRDQQQRRLVIGTWEDDYEGKRTMTLKEDGTGTMVVELSGLKAMLSAPRLRFDMTWAIENGRLQKRTLGGEPANTVQLILKTMGDHVDEPILELTDQRLLLLDKDGKTKYDWRRKTEPAPTR